MNKGKIALVLATVLISTVAVEVGASERVQSVKVKNIKTNTELPSASGMDYINGNYYAIGDDSPYLFQLSGKFDIKDKTLIKEYEIGPDNRIPKKIKPDYEALEIYEENGKEIAIILGSGSKDVRMYGYLMDLGTKEKVECNLTEAYDQMRAKAGFPADVSLNVEGVTVAKDKVVVLNRGNSGDNVIFTINKKEFIGYMKGENKELKSIESYKVALPEITGNVAGLSGVDYLEEENALILTASVECTNDPINDGAILGSFVGAVKMDNLKNNLDLKNNFVQINNDGKAFITKAESIMIKSYRNNTVRGAIASDNDNGTSEFFNFKLKLD